MDIAEVEREIRRCEADKTTWGNCEKLAILYTVKDHYADSDKMVEQPRRAMPQYSYAAAPPVSEFIGAAANAPPDAMLKVLDEHMEAIKTLYPKEYDAVVRKLRDTAK